MVEFASYLKKQEIISNCYKLKENTIRTHDQTPKQALFLAKVNKKIFAISKISNCS